MGTIFKQPYDSKNRLFLFAFIIRRLNWIKFIVGCFLRSRLNNAINLINQLN